MHTIVAGSGIGGLLISDRLSEAGRPHILIAGPRPDPTVPRLGESISLHGTIGLRKAYPNASHFFTSKKALRLVLRRQEVLFDFDFSTSLLRGLGFRLAGTSPPADLIHVDRSAFDAYLYDKVVAQPHASVRNSLIRKVETANDRVRAVRLDDGTRLEVDYFFDATNAGRVLAGPMGIVRNDLSQSFRVIFTHFARSKTASHLSVEASNWRDRTVVMRLFRDRDSLDGVLWSIPLPNKMSIGVSLIRPTNLDDEAVLGLGVERLRNEGFDVEAQFPEHLRPVAFNVGHYIYERAYGPNWMLVGSACANVWWPSGTGVGIAVAAAENAVLALEEPEKAGARYQRYIHTLPAIHRSLDGLLLPETERLDEAVIKRESIRRNLSEAERWLSMPSIQHNPLIRYSRPVRPYVVPLLLRSLKMSHVIEREFP